MVYPRRWCLTTALTLHQLILLNSHASMALSIYWFHLTTLNPVRQPRGLCELLKMLWLNRCLKVQRAFLWNRLANFLFRYRPTPNQRLWSLWMSANPFQLIKYCWPRIVIGLTFVRQEWSFLIMFIFITSMTQSRSCYQTGVYALRLKTIILRSWAGALWVSRICAKH